MVSKKRAREIMGGKSFFGVEEAIGYFGVNPTRRQVAALSEIPFSKAVLEQSKDTHILIAVLPLSIIEIRDKVEKSLFSYDGAWKQPFADERGEVSWELISKTLVDNSTSKNWWEQKALLGDDEEIPTAQVMTYTIIGHYLATGERMFGRVYVRTSSTDLGNDHVGVGLFNPANGLDIYTYWNETRGDLLGLAVSKTAEL